MQRRVQTPRLHRRDAWVAGWGGGTEVCAVEKENSNLNKTDLVSFLVLNHAAMGVGTQWGRSG